MNTIDEQTRAVLSGNKKISSRLEEVKKSVRSRRMWEIVGAGIVIFLLLCALLIANEFEIVAGPNDPYLLAADYGTNGAQLVFIEGAFHATRIEGPAVAARFWEEVFNFIDP